MVQQNITVITELHTPYLWHLCRLHTVEFGGSLLTAANMFLDGNLSLQYAVDKALAGLTEEEMKMFLTEEPLDDWSEELHGKVFANEILQTVHENFMNKF
jgi:hypothetical protein